MNDRQLTEIQKAAREMAERSAREQGLPPKVTDPRVIERIAAILREPPPRPKGDS